MTQTTTAMDTSTAGGRTALPAVLPAAASSPLASDALLPRLPCHLLDLVLQHLQLAELLNHCTHLYRQQPPLSAISIRHCPVLLSDSTVWRIQCSPRLLALLSAATSIVLRLDTLPVQSSTLRWLLGAVVADGLFPRLAHVSCVLSWRALKESLLPFLIARGATIQSLHLAHPPSPFRDDHMSELPDLLNTLPSLRRLRIEHNQLSTSCLQYLLDLPLDTLDLSASTLYTRSFHRKVGPAAPPSASVSDCQLLRHCRVLRLPSLSRNTPSTWALLLDALVVQRPDSLRPHTLTVQHFVSAAAQRQLVDLPPSHALSISIYDVMAGKHPLLAQSVASPHLGLPVPQLHPSLDCRPWYKLARFRPFVSFVAAHHACIPALELLHLPDLPEMVASVLAVVTRCARLLSLRLDCSLPDTRSVVNNCHRGLWRAERAKMQADTAASQARLQQLHTLRLTRVSSAWLDSPLLFALCPALRVCTMDWVDVSVDLLHALATSCPLLRHLQLLHIRLAAPVDCAAEADERQRPPVRTSFRSLQQLDLVCRGGSATAAAELLSSQALLPLLVDRPLKHLQRQLHADARYHAAVAALLVAVPQLRALRVLYGCHMQLGRAGADASMDESIAERAAHPAAQTHSSVLASSLGVAQACSTSAVSSLVSLELLMVAEQLTVEQLSTLLALCPALATIRLDIQSRQGGERVLLTYLRCLTVIGKHCPLVEQVTFQAHDINPRAAEVVIVELHEVESALGTCELPAHAFARVQRIQQAGHCPEVLSEEAAEYVQRWWLRHAGGKATLDMPVWQPTGDCAPSFTPPSLPATAHSRVTALHSPRRY